MGNNASDNQRLIPVVDAIQRNAGALPHMTLADAGYASETNFVALEARNLDACISLAGRNGRMPKRDPDTHPATHRMAQRMATPEGKAHYRRRKVIPEPVFGWIKHAIGFRSFSLRGLSKVTEEWNLVCLVTNLRRMHRLGWQRA